MKNNEKTHLTLEFLKQKTVYEGVKLITVRAELAAPIIGITPRTLRDHLHRLAINGSIDLYTNVGRPSQVEVL